MNNDLIPAHEKFKELKKIERDIRTLDYLADALTKYIKTMEGK